MKLFLSHAGLSEVSGGVERYAHYLSKVFPDMVRVDYHSHKKELGDTFFPPLREPLRAKKLGEFVSKNYPDAEIVFTNGMFCWNLPHKKQVNICHGTYAGFAEHAVEKTSLDYYRLRYLYSHFEKIAAQNSPLVVANSMSTAFNTESFFHKKAKVIYPCVDTSLFRPSAQGKAAAKLGWEGANILFVGRPERAKGFDFVQGLAREMPDANFRCILSRPFVSQTPNLEIISPKEHSGLALYYNASDLVLFPSRFEGFGFVTAEALACNKKVVCLNTGIASEIHSKNIFLSGQSMQELRETISRALSAGKEDSRRLAEHHFSFEKFAANWKACVKEMGEPKPI